MVELAGGRLGGGERLFIIAGPCVVETPEVMFAVAGALAELAGKLGIHLIFKSSYRKANRSALGSPQGPGLEAGLGLLAEIKKKFALPLLTDIHETAEAAPAAAVADVLQIPAMLSRQTPLISAAAATGRVVNIKKGQFMSPELACLAAEKAVRSGSGGVLLTERGTFFGYGDLVVDFRSLAVMAATGWPVVFDATHSVQQPGGAGRSSGGRKEFIPLLARAAVAAGVDGIFLEVHPD
ncbi:MAG TPA: 3-deoxy-8-phosphooctulonate synthase, partial [Candidatus Glassbacteria bacterium]|nr:3-deoxy-8-phosphooctulonate synthase [Candidatus Glassbacteria bacterium]